MNREMQSSSNSGSARRPSSSSSLSVIEPYDDQYLKLHLGDVSMAQGKQLFGKCQVSLTREDMDRLRQRSMSAAGTRPRITGRRRKGQTECLFCGKEFRFFSKLEVHLRVHTNERPFECSICKTDYKRIGHLKNHQFAVHSNARKKFRCDLCGKRFHFKFQLNIHVRRHVGEKPCRCDICGKAFTTSTDLRQHKTYVHLAKNFKCSRCPRVFARKYQLEDHRRRHTGAMPYK